MPVDVALKTAEPTPTAVVTAATEVGVQVTGSFEPHGSVVPSRLPGGPAAAATHAGPMTSIGDTHDAVREWAVANGYKLAGPKWEIYGDPDSATGAFTVEVMWLVAD